MREPENNMIPSSLDPTQEWKRIQSTQTFDQVPRTCRAHSPTTHLRIACISDTHGQHRKVRIPKCDVLVHAGDFTMSGEVSIVQDLSAYFSRIRRPPEADKVMKKVEETVQEGSFQSPSSSSSRNLDTNHGPAEEIICISGNHDITFQPETYEHNWKVFHRKRGPYDTSVARSSLTNCLFLKDEAYKFKHIQFYGSPCTPEYGDCWAYMQSRDEISKIWDKIPNETDVLVTHGPPLGRGDLCWSGVRAGCIDLLRQVQERIQPRIHIFGHIHESAGVTYDGTTLFVNAASCTLEYDPENCCIVVDLPFDPELPPQVVTPQSTLSGREVLEWLEAHSEYQSLIPHFRAATPLLEGTDLVGKEISIEDIAVIKLGLHREREHWYKLKSLLREMLHHLRTQSYE